MQVLYVKAQSNDLMRMITVFTYTDQCESGGMVYTADLKSAAAGLAGSSPASRTKFLLRSSIG